MHLRKALGAVQIVTFVAAPARSEILALNAGNHHPGPLVWALQKFIVAMRIMEAYVARCETGVLLKGASVAHSRCHLVMADGATGYLLRNVLPTIPLRVLSFKAVPAKGIVAV